MGKKDDSSKPIPPKKPLSAFFLYRGEVYEEVRTKNPQAKITDITKIIGNMWQGVDGVVKSRLQSQYQVSKTQYQEDKESYQRNYGKIETKKKKVAKKNKK